MFKQPTNKRDQDNLRITAIIILAAATISVLVVSGCVHAASLDRDPRPFNTSSTEDIDISINPEEGLPINGTLSIATAGITDYDINSLVPAGMSVLIQNDSVTITSNEVTVAPGGIPIQQLSNGNGDEEN